MLPRVVLIKAIRLASGSLVRALQDLRYIACLPLSKPQTQVSARPRKSDLTSETCSLGHHSLTSSPLRVFVVNCVPTNIMQAIKCMSHSESDLSLPYDLNQKGVVVGDGAVGKACRAHLNLSIETLIVSCQTCLLISYTTNAFPVSRGRAFINTGLLTAGLQGEYIPTGTCITPNLTNPCLHRKSL